MDFLREHGIYIDTFKRCSEQIKAAFCSHRHADHAPSDMRSFTCPVHCSAISALLLPDNECVVLRANEWQRVADMDVFVLETIHCPGSLGFFFRDWGILYLGDTRITPTLRKRIRFLNPHTILYDGTHEQVKHIQPSIDTSAILLHQVIQQQLRANQEPIHLCLAHIGSLLLIQELDLKVRIHESLKADVVTLLHHGGWVDPASRIMAVGMKASRRDIMPSSLFFVVNDLDPTKPVQDKETLRIFVSFHSSQAELELLNEFELAPLHYQPIVRRLYFVESQNGKLPAKAPEISGKAKAGDHDSSSGRGRGSGRGSGRSYETNIEQGKQRRSRKK